MESGFVNKAQASLTGTAGLERLVGMNAASGRKRASNTAACIRLHRVGASNPRLGVRGGWLQDEQRRHCQHRCPFVAVHNGRSLCRSINATFYEIENQALFACIGLDFKRALSDLMAISCEVPYSAAVALAM